MIKKTSIIILIILSLICSLIIKNSSAQPPPPAEPSEWARVEYMAHLQGEGDTIYYQQPEICGTEGESRRLEGFAIRLQHGSANVGLRYRAHIQDEDDTEWHYLNEFVGTRGEHKRLEAFWIEVTHGNDNYSVYYCAHVEGWGWTGWFRDGEMCGTRHQSRRIEAIKVFIAGEPGPGDDCGTGNIYDCDMRCVNRSWVRSWTGDRVCDDGRWGLDLNCEEFGFDGGDCDRRLMMIVGE